MRDYDAEQSAFQDAIGLFETMEDMVFTINTILDQEGQPKVTRQAVEKWQEGVPAERARIVELATGGAVKREALRPDLYA